MYLARGLPLLSRQLNSREGDVSIHSEMHTFARQRGWKWSICPRGYRDPADYGWNRDAQRSKRVERRLPISNPFRTSSRPPDISPFLPLPAWPFFLFLIRQVSRYHACMIQTKSKFGQEWRGNRREWEKVGNIVVKSNWFLQRHEGRDGGGFNILIKTTRGFVVGVNEG